MKRFAGVDAIKIQGNRQRKEFKERELQEMVTSIQSVGLLHPIVLRIVGDDYVLVAGERRLRAIKDIYELGGSFTFEGQPVLPDMVPHTLLGDLNELDAKEAELEENIRRVDLTWMEKATATSDLMELRQLQATKTGMPAPTVATLSEEIRGSSEGYYQTATKKELILAKHLGNPAVASAKTADEAFKILKKQEQATRHKDLAKEIGKHFTSAAHTLENKDCLEWLDGYMAESFDVILTDPPYGMGADEFGDSGGMAEGAHGYSDSSSVVERIIRELPASLFRLAKPQAHAYIFCDIDWFAEWRTAMQAAGWQVFRTPLIWHKPTGMRAPWPDSGPQRKYETILYAVKGKKPVTKIYGDVLSYPSDENLGHGAQKPVALYRDLLIRSITPGDSVLDPFCGTGPIFAAAHELKCKATGIELDPTSYGIAATRIKGLV